MKPHILLVLILLMFIQSFISGICLSSNLDHSEPEMKREVSFFYFIQMWPGSFSNTGNPYCHETIERISRDFVIEHLIPAHKNGSEIISYRSDTTDNTFNIDEIDDLIKPLKANWPIIFPCPRDSSQNASWAYKWSTYGVNSNLDQHGYFKMGLNLKRRVKLIKILQSAGIEPNGEFYSVHLIQNVTKEAVGFAPGIQYNKNKDGENQLYRVVLCVSILRRLMECPQKRVMIANASIKFPMF